MSRIQPLGGLWVKRTLRRAPETAKRCGVAAAIQMKSRSLEPDTSNVGDSVSAKGENVDKPSVAEV
jgi:hypothetical protein